MEVQCVEMLSVFKTQIDRKPYTDQVYIFTAAKSQLGSNEKQPCNISLYH